MSFDLKRSIVQIRDQSGIVRGTGFLINPDVAVTCAHVVNSIGAVPGDSITIAFAHSGDTVPSLVLSEAWRPSDKDDIAVLHLQGQAPRGVIPIIPGSSENTHNHAFSAFGYPEVGDIQGVWAQGTILGHITDSRGTTMLQIRAQEIAEGMSGAPVLDIHGNRVVGMVTATYYNPNGGYKLRDVAFATPIEAIAEAYPKITLVPPSLPATDPDSTLHVLRSAVNQAPPIPAYFVARPEITNKMKERLLVEPSPTPGVINVTALLGLGGIGKSTVAAALAHDPDLQQRYSNGILWATLGQQPDLLFILNNWIQTLGDYDFKATTTEAASSHLRRLLHQKSVLLILDDVWDYEHGRVLRGCGSQGHILMTTRRYDVAEEMDARVYRLDVMSPAQTLELFGARMNRTVTPAERSEALRLAESVGFLPLALELAAARVAHGTSWTALHHALEKEVAQLEALEAPRRRRRTQSRVEASFHLSLKAIQAEDEETRRAFIWLGILPEDVQVTAPMLATICQVDIQRATDILDVLWNDALLLPGPKVWIGEQEWPSFRLHDLLRDIARRLLTLPPPGGLGLELPAAHAIVLERYHQKTEFGLWHTVPNDGYIHVYLTWHMQQAGQSELVHKLLGEETAGKRNGWYHAREQLGQTAGYLADVWLGLSLAQEAYKANPQGPAATVAMSQHVRYALIIASLNSLARNLPLPLLLALVEKKMWTPAQGLAYARQVLDLEQQVKVLIELSIHLSPGMQTAAFQKALEIAQSIDSRWEQTQTLMWLAQRLAELDQPGNALQAVQAITSESWQTKTLTSIIRHLPQALLPQTLEFIRTLDREYQAEALAELVVHLPAERRPEILEDTLAAIAEVTDEEMLTESLVKLAPHLPEAYMAQAMAIAQTIEWEGARAEALAEIAPYLPEPARQTALENVVIATESIRYDEQRGQILVKLAPHLPEALLTRATKTAWAIKSAKVRAKILAKLAPHLPDEARSQALDEITSLINEARQSHQERVALITSLVPFLPEALGHKIVTEAVSTLQFIENDWVRAEVVAGLAPHLPKNLLDQALELTETIQNDDGHTTALAALTRRFSSLGCQNEALATARKIDNNWQRAKVLVALAPQLESALEYTALVEALDAARTIQNEVEQAAALAGIAPHLARLGQPAEALDAVKNIWYEKWQAKALAGIAPHLPDPQLLEALKVAQAIRDRWRRTEALVGLAPYLPDPLLTTALKSAQAIHDEQRRAEALLGLVPYLPEKLKQTALQGMLVAAQTIWDEAKQLEIFAKLAPDLPPALRERMLGKIIHAVWRLPAEQAQASLLSRLVAYMPKPLHADITEKVLAMADTEAQTQALLSLIPYLAPEQFQNLLAVIPAIRAEADQSKLLIEVAPYLQRQELAQALHILAGLRNEPIRAKTLTAYIPFLADDLLPTATAIVRNIQDEWRQAEPQAGLAMRLAQFDQPDQALAMARTIWDEVERAVILTRLMPHLPEPLDTAALMDALSAYRTIWYAKWRAEVLAEMVPNIPDELKTALMQELLVVIANLRDERKKAEALIPLTPFLQEDLLSEALEIVEAIQDSHRKALLLAELMPISTIAHRRVLKSIRLLPYPNLQAPLLIQLAIRLPEEIGDELIEEALALTWSPDNQEHVADTLSELVPTLIWLPRPRLFEVWQAMLTYLTQRTRQDLLSDLHTLEPVISQLGKANSMAGISEAIQDVGRWWP